MAAASAHGLPLPLFASTKLGAEVDQRCVGCSFEITEHERQVILGYAAGMTAGDLAQIYGWSVWTIRDRTLSARRKLRAKNQAHLVAEALRAGVIA